MKNWVKIAGISGIVIIAVSFILGLLGALIGPSYIISFATSLLTSAGAVFFFYGFFVIGKKYKKTLLRAMSIYFIVIAIIGFFVYIPLTSYIADFQDSSEMQQVEENLLQLEEQYGGMENVPEDVLAQEIGGYLGKILIFLGALYLVFVLFYGLPSILFGIGILKLGKNVKYSKVTGILNIIGGATSVILVGFIILGVASIFEIVLLFAEADRFGK